MPRRCPLDARVNPCGTARLYSDEGQAGFAPTIRGVGGGLGLTRLRGRGGALAAAAYAVVAAYWRRRRMRWWRGRRPWAVRRVLHRAGVNPRRTATPSRPRRPTTSAQAGCAAPSPRPSLVAGAVSHPGTRALSPRPGVPSSSRPPRQPRSACFPSLSRPAPPSSCWWRRGQCRGFAALAPGEWTVRLINSFTLL
jgi:hypothetical protein